MSEYKFTTEACFLAWLGENLPPEQFSQWEEDYKQPRQQSRERYEVTPKHAGTTVSVDDAGYITRINVMFHVAFRRPKAHS